MAELVWCSGSLIKSARAYSSQRNLILMRLFIIRITKPHAMSSKANEFRLAKAVKCNESDPYRGPKVSQEFGSEKHSAVATTCYAIKA